MDEYNQYNQDFNQYNNPYQQMPPPPPQPPIWAAVTSFVLGILNMLFCCCTTYLFAPLSLIFGIVSLVKKWGAKGLAVTGVILSTISLVIMIGSTILMNTVYKEVTNDITKFVENAQEYIEEYDESGEVPDDFKKYCDPQYDDLWKSFGYDSFDEFFEAYIDGIRRGYGYAKENDGKSADDFFDDITGEKPVDL